MNNEAFKEENVTDVTLKSGNTVVATATDTFPGDAENGNIYGSSTRVRAVCAY